MSVHRGLREFEISLRRAVVFIPAKQLASETDATHEWTTSIIFIRFCKNNHQSTEHDLLIIMFKGLRTKIESEQKNQSGNAASANLHLSRNGDKANSQQQTNTFPSKVTTKLIQTADIATHDESDSKIFRKQSSPILSIGYTTGPNIPASQIETDRSADPRSNDVTGNLQEQISKLSDQLQSVIKEKDESIEQNTQLYQLIEKLRRNLEDEKNTSSSLKIELESKNREAVQENNPRNRVTNFPIKSFNPIALDDDATISSNDVETLRQNIIELQAQLAKKNRLLKIKQQNLTDIKKTLQRELFDHSRTQEELSRIQKQLKIREDIQSNDSEAPLARQNGSISHNSSDISELKRDHNQNLSDKNPVSGQPTSLPSASSCVGSAPITGEDAISLSAVGGGAAQFDRISSLSHSSASVDELDSNDLQQANFNRDVNHEYLKNVLFRYMTSTDTETTQHLVKAITVLMDFSPDQYDAIKEAICARASWLRLK